MKDFKKFLLYEPVHMTYTSTTWDGLQPLNAMCYGCIYSCVKYGRLMCNQASRTVANTSCGQKCISYVSRNERSC